MKNNARILVVEDNPFYMNVARFGIGKFLNIKDSHILEAMTLARAEVLFNAHKTDIVAICLDGCVDNKDNLDTLPFISLFRDEGFQGPIVTTSRAIDYREIMLECGCTHECREKMNVGRVLADILNNQR